MSLNVSGSDLITALRNFSVIVFPYCMKTYVYVVKHLSFSLDFFSLFRRFIHYHYKIFMFLLHIVATLRILNKDQKPNLTCVTFPLQTF